MPRKTNRGIPGPDRQFGWAGRYHWVEPLRLSALGREALGSDVIGPWPTAVPGLTPDSRQTDHAQPDDEEEGEESPWA